MSLLPSPQSWTSVCIVWACVSFCNIGARGAVIDGELPASPYLAEYVGKFCFDVRNSSDTVIGLIRLDTFREVDAPAMTSISTADRMYFLIYNDWKVARKTWSTSTCEEKKQMASYVMELVLSGEKPARTYFIRVRERIRPRFWYYTFVNCGKGSPSPVRFSIHSENTLLGWQSEFSVDHLGLVSLHVVCSMLFTFAILVNIWCTRCRPSEHPYCKLLLLSYASSTLSCLAKCAHYAKFMQDGFGSQRLRFLGVVAAIVADSSIFVIAMMVSAGWAISSFSLSNRRCFLSSIALIVGVCALCELYGEVTFDESTTLYSYQSPGGIVALTLKIFYFCWFSHQIKSAYDEELQRKQKQFYKVFGFAFSLWFSTVPITVLLAYDLHPWFQFKIVTAVELLARLGGQVLLSALLIGPASPLMPLPQLRGPRQYPMGPMDDLTNSLSNQGY